MDPVSISAVVGLVGSIFGSLFGGGGSSPKPLPPPKPKPEWQAMGGGRVPAVASARSADTGSRGMDVGPEARLSALAELRSRGGA